MDEEYVEMSEALRPVCGLCGSEDVRIDATAVWHYDDQQWVVKDTRNGAHCYKCDSSTWLDWVYW